MRRFYNLKGKAATLAALAGVGNELCALRISGSVRLFAALVLFSAEPRLSAALAIEQMTIVNKGADTGYFQDPYPVHKALSNSPDIQLRAASPDGGLRLVVPPVGAWMERE